MYKAGRSEARAYLMLASLRKQQNAPAAARDFVERALPFYRQGSYRKEMALAYTMLAHAYDQSGSYDSAIKTFKDLLELAQQVGDQQQVALSHEGIGVALNHQQNILKRSDTFGDSTSWRPSLETRPLRDMPR